MKEPSVYVRIIIEEDLMSGAIKQVNIDQMYDSWEEALNDLEGLAQELKNKK